jgi:hypothetical protein
MKKKTIATLLGLGGWVAVGACTASATHPPGVGEPTTLDDGGSGSSSGGSGSGGRPEADGSTVRDGASEDAAPSDAPGPDVLLTIPSDSSMPEPTCNPNKTWGSATATPGVQLFATQPLVTITNDELTVAWVVDNGGQGNVFVADRTSTSAAFGTPNQLVAASLGSTTYVDGEAEVDGGNAYFAFDRVALSSDGLTLIGVAVGSLHMAQFTRTSRSATFFANPLESRYEGLAAAEMTGEKLGDPVLAANGEDLVYSRYGLSPSLTIYESFTSTTTQTWPPGSGDGTMALAEDGGRRKRPTSITADRLTLFVWDEAGEAYGVIRTNPMADFNYAIPFGDRFSIQINGDCSRIYYVAASGSNFELVQADAM